MVRTLVVLVIALALALPYAGSFLVVDRPLPSDVIVVLAGDVGSSRFNRGVEALKAGLGRELFIDADSRNLLFGKTMAQMAQAYIQTMPPQLAAHIHVCPITSKSTFAESGRGGAMHSTAASAPRIDRDFRLPHPAGALDLRAKSAAICVVGGSGVRRKRISEGLLAQAGMAQNNAGGVGEACLLGTGGALEESRTTAGARLAQSAHKVYLSPHPAA